MQRRDFLKSAALFGAVAALPSRVFASQRETLRVGYLPTLSCDSHLWVGLHHKAWHAQGIEIKPTRFITGLEAYQALAGGSIDLVTTGAVIANFPARGQGKVFLVNALETAMTQIYVSQESGIKTLADLKGQRIATTRGTSAHYLLHEALKSVGLDSAKDVEIVHQRMDQAVTSFVAGSVPVVALWTPFDSIVRQHRASAIRLTSAAEHPNAVVVDGWSARNELHASNPELLQRFIKGWEVANDQLINHTDDALKLLAAGPYKQFSVEELKEQYQVVRWDSPQGWLPDYQSGKVTEYLNAITRFNQDVGALNNPIWADDYFDPSLYIKTFG